MKEKKKRIKKEVYEPSLRKEKGNEWRLNFFFSFFLYDRLMSLVFPFLYCGRSSVDESLGTLPSTEKSCERRGTHYLSSSFSLKYNLLCPFSFFLKRKRILASRLCENDENGGNMSALRWNRKLTCTSKQLFFFKKSLLVSFHFISADIITLHSLAFSSSRSLD